MKMDLKDEIKDQSLDDVTITDVSTNDKCTNDVTKDEITSADVTETKADNKEVSLTEPVADGVKDPEQAPTEEPNGTSAGAEITAHDAEIEITSKIAQKSETETENSEEHTVSKESGSNQLEQISNGHMSEKQERLFWAQMLTL